MNYGTGKGIRRTSSGVAFSGATVVTAFTVNAVNADCIVNLRDGLDDVNGHSPILWTLEADNAASSPTVVFPDGLNFDRGVYMEFTDKGSQSSASIAVRQ